MKQEPDDVDVISASATRIVMRALTEAMSPKHRVSAPDDLRLRTGRRFGADVLTAVATGLLVEAQRLRTEHDVEGLLRAADHVQERFVELLEAVRRAASD